MLIGFATSGLNFSGDSLQREALGGSETALCSLAYELTKRGHQVRVYCECDRPGEYDGVSYFHRDEFAVHATLAAFDVVIVSRWAQFLARPLNAALRVLWNHDVLTDGKAIMPMLWQTDLVMCLSDYHIDDWCGPVGEEEASLKRNKLPHLRPHIWKTSNGVDIDLIERNIQAKDPGMLIYTSRPERGLLYLMKDIMPRLWEKRPGLRLHYCNYPVTNMQVSDEVKRIHQVCEYMAHQEPDRIINMGHLPKEGLYQQMSKAQLLLYPTAFPEISCLSAMESHACGTPLVTTNDFALKETVGDGGIKIDGLPDDQEYIDRFVEATLSLLDEQDAPELNEKGKQLAEAGPGWVRKQGYVWADVAASWEKKFSETIEQRYRDNKGRVIQELLRNHDVQVAKILAKKEGLPEWRERTEAAAKAVVAGTPEIDPEEILDGFQQTQSRFDQVVAFLGRQDPVPKSLLDYRCSEVAFGIIAKRCFPEMEVTLLARDAEVATYVQAFCQKCHLDVTVTVEPEKGKRYDCVFLADQIDTQPDPQNFLARLQNAHLAEGGLVAFTCRYGTEHLTAEGPPQRLWNFDSRDFADMLEAEGHLYHLSFVDDRQTPAADVCGHWVGGFQHVKKFGKINIRQKARRTRPYQSLAVAMITRNEEDDLRRCLKSCNRIADRISVADSQSTDRTVQIVEEFGAEVRVIEFDNFAQARNVSKEGLTEDWILWIDADEKLLNAEILRRYLHTTIFNGFGIRQNHLQLDLQGNYDLPIRLFRNLPHYQFVGLIHEHAEDTSRGPYDNEITPTMVLDETDILHFGYENEAARRRKCSFRNMDLLIRELHDSQGKRQLDWILVMRDFLNILKWKHAARNEKATVRPGSQEHALLNGLVDVYLAKFAQGKAKYKELAEGLYQDALLILGGSGLCYRDRSHPPIQVELGMAGAVGGMASQQPVLPKRRWFLDADELQAFVSQTTASLATKLGVCEDGRFADRGRWEFSPPQVTINGVGQLLQLGVEYQGCR